MPCLSGSISPDRTTSATWSHGSRRSICRRATACLNVAIELIERFVASPRAAALAKAKQLYRELEFLLCWPPDETAGNDGCQKYIEGFIDCLYQGDDGRWRILDYKTNVVTAATLPAVAAGYEMQMLLYALAAEKVLGEPPAEMVLHFMRLGVDFSFSYSAAAVRQMVEEVSPIIGNSQLFVK